MADPGERQAIERRPNLFVEEARALKKRLCRKPLLVVDEVQKVPDLMDAAQVLIDEGTAQLVLTGSSARKLRRGSNVNLLAGRVVVLRLDPLTHLEIPDAPLKDHLLYGSLPAIHTQTLENGKEESLVSYSVTYLEEEVRAEGLARNLASFGRFLELAATESGRLVNFSRLSQQIGVSHTTIMSYYQVLEDCLITERVEPIIESASRKRLVRAEKHLFFDLGVRRTCAGEGTRPPLEHWGRLLEQWVGLELVRLGRLSQAGRWKLRFWRDPSGREVDWVLEGEKGWIPLEVKWTDSPAVSDARHLHAFQTEYRRSRSGYVVCCVPRPIRLSDTVTALPWNRLQEVFNV
jgi:predicted AAA+ superfamily ATPase